MRHFLSSLAGHLIDEPVDMKLYHSSPPFQIYQSSVAYGPHATQTSGGYYHLGKVFLRENKPDVAISLHDQVGGGGIGEGGGRRREEGGGRR